MFERLFNWYGKHIADAYALRVKQAISDEEWNELVELAERGYVVLAPAYPLMAGYQPDLDRLGYRSGTMKAIWDNIRGLDLLESLPMVKKAEFGAVGHSLGGHNAIYTAVFDQRIKVVVSSCGFVQVSDGLLGGRFARE